LGNSQWHASDLSDEFLDAFAVAGPVDECVSRLASRLEEGLDRIVMVPGSRHADQVELKGSISRMGDEMRPQLR